MYTRSIRLTDMSVRHFVQEFSQFWGVDEVAIVSEADSVRAVDIKRLSLSTRAYQKSVLVTQSAFGSEDVFYSSPRWYGGLNVLVPAVGYLRWPIPIKPGKSRMRSPFLKTWPAMPLPLHW